MRAPILFLKFAFPFISIYICVYSQMLICVAAHGSLRKGITFLEARVTGYCELCNLDAGNQTQIDS